MTRPAHRSLFPRRGFAATLSLFVMLACGSDEAASAEATPFAPRAMAASQESALDSDWPQWRGLGRDGKSLETNIAGRLPAQGPSVLWSRPFGLGFSGIAVANGCLMSSFGEGDSSFLVRLDPATGEEVWRYRLGKLFKENYGDGPRSTPTIDGGFVYAMTSRAVVVAVDLETGKQVWKVDLAKEFQIDTPEFRGYASSPLVEGELVVVQVGPTDGKSLAALNKTSGAIEWTALDGRSAFSSPLATTIHGKRQILSTIAAGIAGVDALSGEKLWEYPWVTKFNVSVATPIHIAPDRVFLSVGYDQGAVMLSLSREGELWKAEPLWSSRKFRNHFSSSVQHAGHLYGFDDSQLKCISDQDGAELWKRRGLGKGSLIYADGVLIVLGEEGLLSLFEATPEACNELGSVQVFEGRSWTAPTLAGGRLYLRDTKQMVCLDLRSEDADLLQGER